MDKFAVVIAHVGLFFVPNSGLHEAVRYSPAGTGAYQETGPDRVHQYV